MKRMGWFVTFAVCGVILLVASVEAARKPSAAAAKGGFWADSLDNLYHGGGCARYVKPSGQRLVTGGEKEMLALGYFPDPVCLPNRRIAERAGRVVRVESGAAGLYFRPDLFIGSGTRGNTPDNLTPPEGVRTDPGFPSLAPPDAKDKKPGEAKPAPPNPFGSPPAAGKPDKPDKSGKTDKTDK